MSLADILITIDVEDWFQVENFKPWIPYESWSKYELRVERNTHRLLDLFDCVVLRPPGLPACQPQTECHPKMTFFILGWIAERLPNLIREIQKRGHEIASHGYNHNLCYRESRKDLEKDLRHSKKLLEDLVGVPIYGYRAPSFSINEDILKMIQHCGYQYDSSYNSFSIHGRYGKLEMNSYGKKGIAIVFPNVGTSEPPSLRTFKPSSLPASQPPDVPSFQHPSFCELPVSNLEFNIKNSKFILPWAGGGYFRLTPLSIFRAGIQHILKQQHAYVFYLHPWEIEPGQPKVAKAKASYKFRHYINLNKSYSRLSKLIQDFAHHRFVTCQNYLGIV